MPAIQASPRVLKEAKQQAQLAAAQIISAYQRRLVKTWDDIPRLFKISPGENFTVQPLSFTSIKLFADYWKNSFEARLVAAIETKADSKQVIKVNKNVETFSTVTLFPEQQGCYESIYNALFVQRTTQAALQDGHTGSGKTFVAAAVIAKTWKEIISTNPSLQFRLHPVMIFTPKGVVEHWKRVLESFGLAELVSKRKIYVMSDSEFTTEFGDIFCSEVEDPITGDVSLVWKPPFIPVLAVFDECHRYVRWETTRTKKALALIQSPIEKRLLFMSATPMEKVNDAMVFTTACNTQFMGLHITPDTFKQFAGLLDNNPAKPNREAVKRLRSVLNPYIFSLPYVKPKYKAINLVQLVDFRSEVDRNIYNTAHQRYIEACRKAGKNTLWGQFEKLIALNNYLKTVEPLRAWHIAQRVAENYRNNTFATAVGCKFKETIAQVTFELVDKYNIPREQISLIWGGKREYRTEELLTREEVDKILANPNLNELLSNRPLLKRVRLTLRYLQDQHEHSESPEEQAYRHSKMKELKLLGKQSDDARQYEIDKYQDGSAKICLFTIASGGIGLSLDRDKPHLLPRQGLFTPVYSGKEFQQLLGRLVRRASLSDAYQYICMMRGTVEEHHVTPILDEKLKCIAEITNRSFDAVDLLSQVVDHQDHITVRDEQQAELDAEKDDTLVNVEEEDDDEEVVTAEDILK